MFENYLLKDFKNQAADLRPVLFDTCSSADCILGNKAGLRNWDPEVGCWQECCDLCCLQNVLPVSLVSLQWCLFDCVLLLMADTYLLELPSDYSFQENDNLLSIRLKEGGRGFESR